MSINEFIALPMVEQISELFTNGSAILITNLPRGNYYYLLGYNDFYCELLFENDICISTQVYTLDEVVDNLIPSYILEELKEIQL